MNSMNEEEAEIRKDGHYEDVLQRDFMKTQLLPA